MNRDEFVYILELLNDANDIQDWDVILEAIDYINELLADQDCSFVDEE